MQPNSCPLILKPTPSRQIILIWTGLKDSVQTIYSSRYILLWIRLKQSLLKKETKIIFLIDKNPWNWFFFKKSSCLAPYTFLGRFCTFSIRIIFYRFFLKIHWFFFLLYLQLAQQKLWHIDNYKRLFTWFFPSMLQR